MQGLTRYTKALHQKNQSHACSMATLYEHADISLGNTCCIAALSRRGQSVSYLPAALPCEHHGHKHASGPGAGFCTPHPAPPMTSIKVAPTTKNCVHACAVTHLFFSCKCIRMARSGKHWKCTPYRDRQCIHVCAQSNGGRFSSTDGSNNPMLGKWMLVGDLQLIKLLPSAKGKMSAAVRWYMLACNQR